MLQSALFSIFKSFSLSKNKQAIPKAIQRQQGFRRFLKVEKVMEASRVCPAAGQMIYTLRLPLGATKRLDPKKTQRSK